MFVDEVVIAERNVYFGQPTQRHQQTFQQGGLHGVVAGGDVHVLSRDPSQTFIPPCVETLSGYLKEADSLVSLEFLEELPRLIIGIAVANNQLPVRHRLAKNRLHPLFEKLMRIQRRQTDGNEWYHKL